MEGDLLLPSTRWECLPNVTWRQVCNCCFSLRPHLPGKPFIPLCIYDVKTYSSIFWNRPLRSCGQEVRAIFLFFFLMLALLIIFTRLFTDYKSLSHNEMCGCLNYCTLDEERFQECYQAQYYPEPVFYHQHIFFHVPTLGKALDIIS